MRSLYIPLNVLSSRDARLLSDAFVIWLKINEPDQNLIELTIAYYT